MMPYISLAALLLGIWFWIDSLRVRERANQLAQQGCAKADVQFLDGTVSFARLNIVKTSRGFRWRRVYVFDYSEDGENRKEGFMVFAGSQLINLGLQSTEQH